LPSAFVLAAVSAALAQSGLPRNSYLDKRVFSTAQLVHEVKTDSVVMDRYCRHFAMTRQEVVVYLSALRVGALDADGIFTVYGVPHASGDFHSRLKLLKKGEAVFVEEDGTPVLQLICGNPLILGPKKPAIPNPVNLSIGSPDDLQDRTVDSPPVASDVLPAEETPSEGAPVEAIYPESRKEIPNVLTILLGLAGSAGVTVEHHSPAVPEPVSMIVVAGGLAALAARRRSRKR